MAFGDTPITLVGNLVDDPELRFGPSGTAVANFRVASTSRRMNKQTNQWEDSDSLFLRCTAFGQFAENVAESLQRGMRVIVKGALKQRSYEKDGEKRTVYEVTVEEVGPSLRNATAKVNRTSRQGGQGGNNMPDDPWASGAFRAPAGGQQGAGQGGDFSDEPPF
jgi:single-strand DNA-binding protein